MFGWVISKRVRRGYNNAASEGDHALLYLMISSKLLTLLMARIWFALRGADTWFRNWTVFPQVLIYKPTMLWNENL